MEDLELDALCDLLDDNSNSGQEVSNTGSSQPTENDENTVTDLEAKMKQMQEEMKKMQQQIESKKNGSNSRKLIDAGKDLFESPSDEKDTISKDSKSIAIDDFEEEVNPYIETPELSESGRAIQRILNQKEEQKKDYHDKYKKNVKSGPTLQLPKQSSSNNENAQYESFFGIRVLNPLVSSEKMKERVSGRKMIRLSNIQSHIRGGEIKDDWVTIAVVVNKTDTMTSKNGKKFSIWKLCDLQDCESLVSYFLFGEVFQQHWKISVGSVIGLLNPSIMESRESKSPDLSITIDSHYKQMLIGTSKDFGHCKSRKKDGGACRMVVNKSKCEFCQFHVKAAYRKISSKRVELQTTYSGIEPKGLKNKILKNQQIMYGGQSFTQRPPSVGSSKKLKQKDNMLLGSLGMQTKVNKVLENGFHGNQQNASSSPKTLDEMLAFPSRGAQNLLHHKSQEDQKQQVKCGNIKSITAKDLLKMHQTELTNIKLTNQKAKVVVDSPRLGAGLSPGQHIDLGLDSLSTNRKPMNYADIAKLKAIRRINQNGKIQKSDPNAVKKPMSDKNIQENVLKRLDQSCLSESDKDESPPAKKLCKDTKQEKVNIQKIMEMKSSHENEANKEQIERMDMYFGALEKKEQMEDKMVSTTEIVVDVVSCKKCNYTSYHQSDMCRGFNHQITRHKAKKRFFKCSDCKAKTTSLNKIPTKFCSKCGGSNFVRVGMWEERKDKNSEKLFIRDEDLLPNYIQTQDVNC